MKMQYLPLSPKGLPSKEEETPYGPKRALFKIAEHEVIYVVGISLTKIGESYDNDDKIQVHLHGANNKEEGGEQHGREENHP